MEQFTEGESTCEEIKNKLRQDFDYHAYDKNVQWRFLVFTKEIRQRKNRIRLNLS